MLVLILGLIVFLGVHSIRLVANDWRNRLVARMGMPYKGLYALLSLIGIVLIVVGFGHARQHPTPIYLPPVWLMHLNALFMLVALVLFVAPYVPGNHFRSKLGHPQALSAGAWSFGHLLATGMLHDLVLFVPFLCWSIALFTISRSRDRRAGTVYRAGSIKGDIVTVAIGVAAWALFAFWLHSRLIGVSPLV
ncbi:NnrU family protein [Dyella acidiphila]|uniref:NnrU family protein n=1 Tax=Dyella acidiphila TaxID=2775866 RepID=A0ABR9G8A0_9GAMM|nr:NnrU family protein [Dyella acidiphila]MBE1160271.1 NnrU family protein [Dyella acidiphila]